MYKIPGLFILCLFFVKLLGLFTWIFLKINTVVSIQDKSIHIRLDGFNQNWPSYIRCPSIPFCIFFSNRKLIKILTLILWTYFSQSIENSQKVSSCYVIWFFIRRIKQMWKLGSMECIYVGSAQIYPFHRCINFTFVWYFGN